jgi:fumarylacetoacetase
METFIEVSSESYYSIQSLPYSTGRRQDSEEIHCLSRIGDYAIDLTYLEAQGFLGLDIKLFDTSTLNRFMSTERPVWKLVRSRLQDLLRIDNPELRDSEHRAKALVHISQIILTLPVNIGDYTDFYCCKNHAYNVGSLFRPEAPLNPNWVRMPIGYHGRSSSVVLETNVIRPRGQIVVNSQQEHQESKRLDYEVEIGFFIGGKTNPIGHPISISNAYNNIFGLVLLNDWSARDVQFCEYVPLGPFTAKNFMTSISPWIVTLEALEPFAVPLDAQDPVPLEYLQDPGLFTYDISLKTYLEVPGLEPLLISNSNMKYLYWSITQQLAHHTVTGCNMRPGDLIGTGTLSGPSEDTLGCLIEITQGGKKPLVLPNGEQRTFLNDGDGITIIGECKGQGYTIGFELPKGLVLPSINN